MHEYMYANVEVVDAFQAPVSTTEQTRVNLHVFRSSVTALILREESWMCLYILFLRFFAFLPAKKVSLCLSKESKKNISC